MSENIKPQSIEMTELSTLYLDIQDRIPYQEGMTYTEKEVLIYVITTLGIDFENDGKSIIEISTNLEELTRLMLFISRSFSNPNKIYDN